MLTMWNALHKCYFIVTSYVEMLQFQHCTIKLSTQFVSKINSKVFSNWEDAYMQIKFKIWKQ